MKKVQYAGISIQYNDFASVYLVIKRKPSVAKRKGRQRDSIIEEAAYPDIDAAILDVMESLYRRGWNAAVDMMRNRVDKMEVKE